MKANITSISTQAPDKQKKAPKKRARKIKRPESLKKVGRKPWVPDYGKIENWASQGLQDKEIAALSGITATTFCEKKNELPELKVAIELGRAKGVAACCQKLLSLALGGCVKSLIFYLERIGGRRNVTILEPPRKPIHEMTDEELRAILNGEVLPYL
jgi:hypothetical protein